MSNSQNPVSDCANCGGITIRVMAKRLLMQLQRDLEDRQRSLQPSVVALQDLRHVSASPTRQSSTLSSIGKTVVGESLQDEAKKPLESVPSLKHRIVENCTAKNRALERMRQKIKSPAVIKERLPKPLQRVKRPPISLNLKEEMPPQFCSPTLDSIKNAIDNSPPHVKLVNADSIGKYNLGAFKLSSTMIIDQSYKRKFVEKQDLQTQTSFALDPHL